MTMPAGWNSNQSSDTHPNLGNQHTIWKNDVMTGIINRKIVESQVITNLRVYQNSRSIALSDLDDILVMNQHRESQFHGQRYSFRGTGISYGTGRGSGKSIGDVAFIYQGQPSIVFPNIADPSGVARLAKAARKSIIRQIKIWEQIQAKLQKEQESERKRAEKSQNQSYSATKASTRRVFETSSEGQVMCQNCGSTNPQDAKFCRMCGVNISSACSQCGHLNPSGSGFCNSCGHVLA
jgi:ribosomal protein L40E